MNKSKSPGRSRSAENGLSLQKLKQEASAKEDFPRDSVGKVVPSRSNEVSRRQEDKESLVEGGKTMDQKSFEINRLNLLNECLCETIAVLARAQRIGLPFAGMGLSHTPFTPNFFGVPAMDPRSSVEYPGFSHSPYNYGTGYPYGYNGQTLAGWTAQGAVPQTHVDPFLRDRVGFSHTGLPTTSWTISPYAAEIERQRLQALIARQQYEAMAASWRPFGI